MINSKILKIASNTKCFGLKNTYTHKSNIKNSKCGDRIKVEVVVKEKKIKSLRYETEACILCEASASLLARKIKLFSTKDYKKDIKELNESIRKNVEYLPIKFLVFKDLINKSNISRFDCIMLPFNALLKALKL
jgi:nitrogen fixation NifU-like protein